MKFLFGLVAICGSSTSVATTRPAEDAKLLAVRNRVPRRRVKRGGNTEWQPSLLSISEHNVLTAAERKKNNGGEERPVGGWRKSIKRKVSSLSQQRDSSNSNLGRDDDSRVPLSSMAFAATPFMF